MAEITVAFYQIQIKLVEKLLLTYINVCSVRKTSWKGILPVDPPKVLSLYYEVFVVLLFYRNVTFVRIRVQDLLLLFFLVFFYFKLYVFLLLFRVFR